MVKDRQVYLGMDMALSCVDPNNNFKKNWYKNPLNIVLKPVLELRQRNTVTNAR
jgi:hypothetical protein